MMDVVLPFPEVSGGKQNTNIQRERKIITPATCLLVMAVETLLKLI